MVRIYSQMVYSSSVAEVTRFTNMKHLSVVIVKEQNFIA